MTINDLDSKWSVRTYFNSANVLVQQVWTIKSHNIAYTHPPITFRNISTCLVLGILFPTKKNSTCSRYMYVYVKSAHGLNSGSCPCWITIYHHHHHHCHIYSYYSLAMLLNNTDQRGKCMYNNPACT